ncbi:hypothetical protein [uncultured Ruegeria sp.]|uniref:hypothetical protein n=1 Tax=uncultured Ruegeria sp. TaxID=259304 RepID=UPI0026048F7A|nr:hypothetical protein [uncultured Ruegeria sp.]
MARLTINPNYSLKDLGCEVLNAARGRALGSQDDQDAAERKIQEILADSGNPEVRFVYDTKDMVHIVVPDLSDKKPDPNPDHESWCCKLAYEAMGGIVIFGCSG